MSVYKRKDSPYYWTRFTINGVLYKESTKEKSKQAAQRYEDQRKHELREVLVYGETPKKLWKDAADRWLKEAVHKRTLGEDAQKLKWINKVFDGVYLHQITNKKISELIDIKLAEKVSTATVNRTLALIKAILNRCYREWGWLDKVPYIRLYPEHNHRIRWLTPDEEAPKLLKELPSHLSTMAEFTLLTGLREYPLVNLEWSDIDLVNRILIVRAENSKSGKTFAIPLNSRAIEILLKQIRKHPKYVFTYKGNKVTQCNTKAFRKALKRAGIEDFRWHDLRHTWASWHAQRGTPLLELKELGGWSTMSMVLRYAHLAPSNLQKAAEKLLEVA